MLLPFTRVVSAGSIIAVKVGNEFANKETHIVVFVTLQMKFPKTKVIPFITFGLFKQH